MMKYFTKNLFKKEKEKEVIKDLSGTFRIYKFSYCSCDVCAIRNGTFRMSDSILQNMRRRMRSSVFPLAKSHQGNTNIFFQIFKRIIYWKFTLNPELFKNMSGICFLQRLFTVIKGRVGYLCSRYKAKFFHRTKRISLAHELGYLVFCCIR